jgi:hypothetical protein
MKREPLADYRVYFTWDPIKRCLVNSEHHDLRPDRGAGEDGAKTTEKEIVIRVQDKDTGKLK